MKLTTKKLVLDQLLDFNELSSCELFGNGVQLFFELFLDLIVKLIYIFEKLLKAFNHTFV
jgi:hypothetical protein